MLVDRLKLGNMLSYCFASNTQSSNHTRYVMKFLQFCKQIADIKIRFFSTVSSSKVFLPSFLPFHIGVFVLCPEYDTLGVSKVEKQYYGAS